MIFFQIRAIAHYSTDWVSDLLCNNYIADLGLNAKLKKKNRQIRLLTSFVEHKKFQAGFSVCKYIEKRLK